HDAKPADMLSKRDAVRAVACLGLVAALTALAFCARAGAAEVDLSVNARLLLAARNGDIVSVERALREGAAPNARNRFGQTALVIALTKNDTATAMAMLAAGTDVNLAALNGVTPLMAAAFTGQADMASLLLAKGADLRAVDRLQKNAMTYAAGAGRTEIVRL